MHPLLFSITQVEPIWADSNGGMDRLPDLADITQGIRTKLHQKADLHCDNAAVVLPCANFHFEFTSLESGQSLQDLAALRGLIDLDKVVVITGFADVGPWGSSRTH